MTCKSRIGLFGFLLIFSGTALQSWAGTIAVSGNTYTVPPGSTVAAQFFVSNSDAAAASDVEGMTFTVQIADGLGTTPKIMALDLLAGTIWNGHVSVGSIFTPSGGNQLQYQSRDVLTDSPGDYVDANGLLGTAIIDTTGAISGDYIIKLVGTKTAGRDSAFLDSLGNIVPTTFGEGRISILVPEPNTKFFAVAGAWMIAAVGVSRRRHNCTCSVHGCGA